MASCTTALRMLLFQPTPSLRMVTANVLMATDKDMEFQSTPSLRMVTGIRPAGESRQRISIHTILADGDLARIVLQRPADISIHTILADGDAA